MESVLSEISWFQDGKDVDRGLLGCDAVKFTLKMEVVRLPETLVTQKTRIDKFVLYSVWYCISIEQSLKIIVNFKK
jgi:hypothetical protein